MPSRNKNRGDFSFHHPSGRTKPTQPVQGRTRLLQPHIPEFASPHLPRSPNPAYTTEPSQLHPVLCSSTPLPSDTTLVSGRDSHKTRSSKKRETKTKAKEAKQKTLNVPEAVSAELLHVTGARKRQWMDGGWHGLCRGGMAGDRQRARRGGHAHERERLPRLGSEPSDPTTAGVEDRLVKPRHLPALLQNKARRGSALQRRKCKMYVTC